MPCVARGKEPFLLQPTGGPFLGPLFPTNLLQPAIYAGSTLLVTRIAASVSGRHPMQQVGFFFVLRSNKWAFGNPVRFWNTLEFPVSALLHEGSHPFCHLYFGYACMESCWPIFVSIYDNFVFHRFSWQGRLILVEWYTVFSLSYWYHCLVVHKMGFSLHWRLSHLLLLIPHYHAIYEKPSCRGTPTSCRCVCFGRDVCMGSWRTNS